MKLHRIAAPVVIAVAAALAVPAGALGHGSVYTDIARIDTDTTPGVFGSLQDQTRHVVTNHGYTKILRETNGANDKGMVDYSRLPGDYRSTIPQSQSLAEGDTAAQPHATCRGVAALETPTAIAGWQEEDPFYNYVPFQATSAGLEDDPAHWIPLVQTLTGVDLTEGDLATKCAGLAGTYTPADETQTTTASLNSGYANFLTTPLNAQITGLQANLAVAQATIANQQTALKVNLVGKITSKGATVAVTGPAGESVTVTATCKRSDRKTGLTAGALGRASGKLGSDGKAQIKIKLSSKVKKRLKKAKGAKVSFSAVLTKASATASGKI